MSSVREFKYFIVSWMFCGQSEQCISTMITGGGPIYPVRMAMTGMTDYDSMQCRAHAGAAEATMGRIPKFLITRGENGYHVEVSQSIAHFL